MPITCPDIGSSKEIAQVLVSRIELSLKLISVNVVDVYKRQVLFAHEFQFRRENDNLTNIWKSIKQTLSIRSFLKQSELSETMITVKEEKVTRYNPINKQFNQTVHKAVIDIQKDKAVVLIKIPKTQQATKLLKEMETLISEEISSYNPDYYFSQPQRKGKWLFFIGTKRK